MKIDFQNMGIRDLKNYVLQHRDDQKAFQALMDRLDAQSPEQLYTEADVDKISELLQKHQKLTD
jgi:hypothetical protein